MTPHTADPVGEDEELQLRKRILKLRWMGLEQEADDLAKSLRARTETAQPYTRHLARCWRDTD